ncbi:hypothetical protein GPLA_3799 [Paraglaciecola polaris LMG 21857]|uniref:Uncharacterized protein n=1 Tax=Paraglaciecola polaris LMG 21857 TaxID=1129793 RepID=K6YPM7_9ALTE|nr:hypothetical protein GPLA_3799 [Paraglaciecola polaris LMG 21857]
MLLLQHYEVNLLKPSTDVKNNALGRESTHGLAQRVSRFRLL